MARHHSEIELAFPRGRRSVPQNPLDVRVDACLVEHGGVGVEPTQAARVARVTRTVEQPSVPQPTSRTRSADMTRPR